MILDSNILIYAAEPGYEAVRRFIAECQPYLSAISKIEVLGYHRLTSDHRRKLEKLFEVAVVLPISEEVIEMAIALRQQKKMSLGDSIVAATALVQGMILATANIQGFEWIESLRLVNPIAET